MSKPLIIYHVGCQDGFGGAFAAWKKFGDSAEYRPYGYHQEPPTEIAGREIYVVDFSFSLEVMQAMARQAKAFVVIDHHKTAQEAVLALPEHRFDLKRSGASLAWEYFHPDTPVPLFLQYVEDGDLWNHALPDTLAVLRFIYTQPFEFELWDRLMTEFENPVLFAQHRERGKAYNEYRQVLLEILSKKAEEVEFEGYRVLAINAPSEFRSDLGNLLARRKGPFSIVWRYHDGVVQCSLRGDGTIDLTVLAERHGGGGHPNAASFAVTGGLDLPFAFVR